MSPESGAAPVHIDCEQRIAAPAQRVWERLADHEAMPDWFPAREVVRRRPGTGDPNGIGAIRVVRLLGLAVEEQITAFEPERRLAYRVTEGAPFTEHRAAVELEPDGDATRVRWSVCLRPRIPGTGWILHRVVSRILRAALAGLDRSCREH